ncbi:hypothetical protein IWQ62_003039 [Dispira parvispora]|uniref:Uncharacterized protein n=1 Tax=Dispira parvispora TaxID=1520584 RepID=A0A9W8AVK3_9FUNG|nr:hypothetical protein IWQ62_003039 [Dispira parvispora]
MDDIPRPGNSTPEEGGYPRHNRTKSSSPAGKRPSHLVARVNTTGGEASTSAHGPRTPTTPQGDSTRRRGFRRRHRRQHRRDKTSGKAEEKPHRRRASSRDRHPGERTSRNWSGSEEDGTYSGSSSNSSDFSDGDSETYPTEPRSRNSRVELIPSSSGENDSLVSDADSVLDDPDATLKERQEALNIAHPFGLPLWKPALYKKSRSITRFANRALHAMPMSSRELYLNPGNILWVLMFGWWQWLILSVVGVLLFMVPPDGYRYGLMVLGLGRYLLWPFGRYVEREDTSNTISSLPVDGVSVSALSDPTDYRVSVQDDLASEPFDQDSMQHEERQPLLESSAGHSANIHQGFRQPGDLSRSTTNHVNSTGWSVGTLAFYCLYYIVVAPLLLAVSGVCWLLVVTIPMAKLNYKLAKHVRRTPLLLKFRNGDLKQTGPTPLPTGTAPVPVTPSRTGSRLTPSTFILLCTNKAMGLQYYKYTIDGVNIMFINLLGVVLFVLLDAHVIGPWTDHSTFLSDEAFIFILCLVSTIPLAYFIGQAVSSISAQTSLALGAVINATFGSIIEVILYFMAIIQGKAVLVEGSLLGSFLAGLLLMPGLSMIAGGIKHKEQRFNLRSAGVSSTLLIMSIIGAFAPTLFYQTYGHYNLVCDQCPAVQGDLSLSSATFKCGGCRYVQDNPTHDPFYQEYAKPFVSFCVFLLPTTYLIGLWFTLRTHVKHIYSEPQQDISRHAQETRFLNRALNFHILQYLFSSHRQTKANNSTVNFASSSDSNDQQDKNNSLAPVMDRILHPYQESAVPSGAGNSEHGVALAPSSDHEPRNYSSPTLEGTSSNPTSDYTRALTYPVDDHSKAHSLLYDNRHFIQAAKAGVPFAHLLSSSPVPEGGIGQARSSEDRDGTSPDSAHHSPVLSNPHGQLLVATAAAAAAASSNSSGKAPAGLLPDQLLQFTSEEEDGDDAGGSHGHDSPNWSKTKSALVLLACTILFSAVAELLIDCVDSVVKGLDIQEKFLGITLFALAPNVPEFMNAAAFAYYNNIELAVEICSAYTVQVTLLQIPAVVAFSSWWSSRMTDSSASLVSSLGESVTQGGLGASVVSAGRGVESLVWRGLRYVVHSVVGTVLPPLSSFLGAGTETASATSAGLSQTVANSDVGYIFTLIFPRWDLIAVLFSIFLLTYTYIEGKSNYFKGAILCLSYFVWIVSNFYIPRSDF